MTDDGVIEGFLYVPSLVAVDSCFQWSQTNLPPNVTSRQDLPPYEPDLSRIAIAPWVSIDCTQQYLNAVRREGIQALLFYRPGDSDNKPKPGNDIIWSLNDNFLWKEQSRFPVFALSSLAGKRIVDALSKYSGRVEEAPNGILISQKYQTTQEDYLRIWTEISLSSRSDETPVWVFVLVVLAIIGGVIILTSLAMHSIQALRRRALRNRVREGKIDLEALMIARVAVPRWEVDSWPTRVFDSLDALNPVSSPSLAESSLPSSATALSRAEEKARYPIEGQYVCVPCGKPFVRGQTKVTEFPCGHIFEENCVELYTRRTSLCPLCKTCLLPKGWSPPITNIMVRRERAIRPICQDLESACSSEDGPDQAIRLSRLVSRTSSMDRVESASTHPNPVSTPNPVLSASRASPRSLFSHGSSRRTTPASHLPTVCETDTQLPPPLLSPTHSRVPNADVPTATTRLPDSPPSLLPVSPDNGDLEITVINPLGPTVKSRGPVCPSPSSSVRRRQYQHLVGPDVEEEELHSQHTGKLTFFSPLWRIKLTMMSAAVRIWKKIFPVI